MIRPPPRSTLFPYPTLFRSLRTMHHGHPSRTTYLTNHCYRTLAHPATTRRDSSIPGKHRSGLRAYRFGAAQADRKSTRLNSSHDQISYAVFCLKKKKYITKHRRSEPRRARLLETPPALNSSLPLIPRPPPSRSTVALITTYCISLTHRHSSLRR